MSRTPLLSNGGNGERNELPPPTPLSGRHRLIWDVTDSINFTPPVNEVTLKKNLFLRRQPLNKIFGMTGRTFTALVTTVFAGLLIGVTAKVMEEGIDAAVQWRNNFLDQAILHSPIKAVGMFLSLASASVLLTAAVVQWLAPGAAGAGVSLVIALLNGNNIAGLLTPAVYFVKLGGTCVSRMAALALGPEAPMVHLGACITSLIFAVERRLWAADPTTSGYRNWRHDLDPAFSNLSHREMVSAGAAAGLAAAFGAPIGGVLFVLEEACSVWSRRTAWRCLLCTATAVFTMSQLLPSVGGGGILSLSGIYPLSSRQWLKQLPFVVAVSSGAGLLGATFNLLRSGMQHLRAARRKHALRLLEAALVAAITVGSIAGASTLIGRCLNTPKSWKDSDILQWTCPSGQYNDLATALLGSSPFVVRSLLGLGSESEPINDICTLAVPCYYSPWSLAALSAIYLGLMVLCSGLAVPGGLFMPSIIVGGSYGALSGMLLTAMLPPSWDVQPGVYAMVGATAMMAAVFRSSISLVVIIVEGTRGIEFLPGILAATIVSNFIAHWLHPDGIYESELERDGRVFFLRQEPPGSLRWQTAKEIMASPVEGLRRIEEVTRVVELLKSSLHNGFPVYPVTTEDSTEDSRMDGFILRTQLLVLLQERAFCDAQGHYISPFPPHPTAAHSREKYELFLNTLMNCAEISCDGLSGAAELALAVDPLGATVDSEKDEDGVSLGMMPTMETLESLRTLPSLVACLGDGDDDDDRAYDGNTNNGLFSISSGIEAGSSGGSGYGDGDDLAGASPRTAASVLYVNLGPFMDKGKLTVRPDTTAIAVHRMFLALSLRHLCVTDGSGRVVGMITRKDLDNAAGSGHWRKNPVAPHPHRDDVVRSRSWFTASLQSLVQKMKYSSSNSNTSSVVNVGGVRSRQQRRGSGGQEDDEAEEEDEERGVVVDPAEQRSWPERSYSLL